MKRIPLAAAAAAFLLLGSAQAQQVSPVYGELGYSFLKADVGGGSANPSALRAILGYDFHRYFAVEGLLGFGVNNDSTTIVSSGVPVNVKLKVDDIYGVYIKPKYDVNNFELFGRLGWAHAKLKADASVGAFAANGSDSSDSFSYGLGANWNLNPKMRVGLDYMVYGDQNNIKVDGWTISFGYRF